MNFVLIALCLIAGLVLRFFRILPENAHRGINAWILYIALPSMALLYIPAIHWGTALILPAAMPLVVWAGAWLLLRLFARRLTTDPGTHAALLLTAGLGNTSFIGFPLTEAYFGQEGLRVAVICDQVNFIVLSSLGVMTALKAFHASGAADSGVAASGATKRGVLGTLLRFPPFPATIAALVLPRFVDFAPIDPLLTRLAGTLVPLALFSVGLQIHFSDWRRELPCLLPGLAYKLLIAPALIFGTALLFRVKGMAGQASVMEAAMAPMITSAILASEYGLNPRLSSLMVSVGTLVSLATTSIWFLIIRATG
jgi:malate permease and related proteins